MALQHLLLGKLWPEVELNLTTWPNGARAGETQAFVTPGLVVGRFSIWRRLGLTLGAGVRLAASGFRTAHRNWIFSARLPF
ncbi:MAG TPA: hypothetical protein VFD84_15190 [Candidatus Binatia bacterium]|jgi:hypothetical protein|nr:hypothetical protein [Candidatus Binatia bacterium]